MLDSSDKGMIYIYLASTSTIRFLTPIMYMRKCLKARNNPYSSNFGWE